MHYGTIKTNDIANGIGVRTSLFVSGCTNRCPHCFQPETWAFDYGTPFTQETIDFIVESLAPPQIQGLSLLGGEPMEPANQAGLLPLVKAVKQAYPDKTIWSYTGFTWEQLQTQAPHPRCDATDELLSYLDVLVDGRFVEELKDITLLFRGSRNQRLIDMKATLATGIVTLWSNQG